MNIYSFIAVIVTCLHFSLGVYALLINYRSIIHKLFFIACFCLSIWSFSAIFFYPGPNDLNFAVFLFQLSCIGFFFYFAFNLNFCIKLTGIKIHFLYYIILYLLPLFFTIISFVDYKQYGIISFESNHFVLVINKYSIWTNAYIVYQLLTIFLCVIVLFYWKIKNGLNKIKKQAYLLIFANLFTYIFALSSAYITPFIIKKGITNISPLLYSIWTIISLFEISRYQFLSSTSGGGLNDLLMGFDDVVIFLDRNFIITANNSRAEKILKIKENDLQGSNLTLLLNDYEKLKIELFRLLNEESKNFSTKISLMNNLQNKTLIDAKFSIVKDKFGDVIGILMVGREVKEIKQLKSYYKISEREAEVIQKIVNGYTNKEIGDRLGITERTVKMHVASVYDKLGVENKAQLFAFLKDFNLIPEMDADRVVII